MCSLFLPSKGSCFQPPCCSPAEPDSLPALVQVDRLFDWQAHANAPIQETLDAQKPHVRTQFQKQLDLATLNLNEQGASSCSRSLLVRRHACTPR